VDDHKAVEGRLELPGKRKSGDMAQMEEAIRRRDREEDVKRFLGGKAIESVGKIDLGMEYAPPKEGRDWRFRHLGIAVEK
jgi:hypothetical protein